MKNFKNNFSRLLKGTLMVAVLASSSSTFANEDSNIASMRGDVPLNTQAEPNVIPKINNKDIKKGRNYPMQPPVIPHSTRNYEISKNSNKCMSCHSRQQTTKSQAPMVSVTHFMDRDGNFLAEISPRRYFCDQCHVTQLDTKPPVENEFIDMHSLMKEKTANK